MFSNISEFQTKVIGGDRGMVGGILLFNSTIPFPSILIKYLWK